ncbi:YdcH family protein [Pararhizobium haloflavum]|uniref:YdcH family protein n=1 Tax=Pararhizobium haloflavum TaxID=2037914 RepID=UPI000C1A1D1F|nr:YdcH family protein [Pararhizobium haloflavum]
MRHGPFLKTLRHRRQAVQARIEHEQSRPLPDSSRLQALKKLKLRFREQIEFIERLNRRGEMQTIPVVRKRSFTPAFARARG